METDPASPSPLAYAGGVVALFAAAGAGLGLATNFSLGFLIEQFVEPGGNPMDNTLVGIMFLHGVVTPLLVGPVVATVGGVLVGRAFRDRRLVATGVGGVASLVGFYLMAGLALLLTVAVLQLYAPGAGGGGGGGGGGGSPISPAALGTAVLEGGIPVALVGAVSAYVAARL